MAFAPRDSCSSLASSQRGIEARIAEIGHSRGPLRYALAAVASRLVETRGWERLGFARLSDYAREQAGLSARQVHDLARTSERLHELPGVKLALCEGTLSWTAARLVARAATAADEVFWIARARDLSADALEHEVRAVDRGAIGASGGGSVAHVSVDEDGHEDGLRTSVQMRCSASVRGKWNHARSLACRVAGERLTPWQCAEAVAAEVLSALPVHEELEPLRFGAARPRECDVASAIDTSQGALGAGSCLETAATAAVTSGPPARIVEFGRGTFAQRTRARWSARQQLTTPSPGEAATGIATPSAAVDGSPPPNVTASLVAVMRDVPTPPAFLRPLTAGLDAADAFELDRRLRRAVALEQRLDAEIGSLLFMVAEQGLHRVWGIPTLDELARERLGMSPRKTRMLLRLERAARRCPALREAYRGCQLSWVRAHALVPIALAAPGWTDRWIVWAERITVQRLEEDVERALCLAETDAEVFEQTGGLPLDAGRSVNTVRRESVVPDACSPNRQIRARRRDSDRTPQEPCRFFFTAPRDVARLFRATLCTVRRALEQRTGRIPTEGQVIEAMLDHAFAVWDPEDRDRPRAHRVFERDGWRCTVPGCSSYRNLHDHHIAFRSAGGSNALDNRTTLCVWHHLRGVHAGIVSCLGHAPGALRFELGRRRRRRPLLVYRSGDVLYAEPSGSATGACSASR